MDSTMAIDLTGDFPQNKSPWQVNVNLCSLNGRIERTILLSERSDRMSIDVGRSSKNPERAMQPHIRNAWIDSPVMSRHHAKIHIESNEEKTVYIQDLKSTHGTRLNSNKIPPYQKIALASGDTLSFGTSVIAGSESHSPKIFQVRFRWEKIRDSPLVITPESNTDDMRPRTFSVPSPTPSDEEVSEEEVEEVSEEECEAAEPIPQPLDEASHPQPQVQVKGPTDLRDNGSFIEYQPSEEPVSDDEGPESMPIVKSTSPTAVGQPRETRTLSREAQKSPSYSPSSPEYSPSSPPESKEVIDTAATSNAKVHELIHDFHESKKSSEVALGSAKPEGYSLDIDFDREESDWMDERDGMDDFEDDVDNMHNGDYPSEHESNEACASSDGEESLNGEDHGPVQAVAPEALDPIRGSQDNTNSGRLHSQKSLDAILSTMSSSGKVSGLFRASSPSDAAMPKQAFGNARKDQDKSQYPETRQPDEVNPMNLSSFLSPDSTRGHEEGYPEPTSSESHGQYSQGPFTMDQHAPHNQAPHTVTAPLNQPFLGSHALNNAYSTTMLPFGYRVDETLQMQNSSVPYYGGDQLVDMELGFHRPSMYGSFRPDSQVMPPILSYTTQSTGKVSTAPVTNSKQPKLAISHLVNDQDSSEIEQSPVVRVSGSAKRKADQMNDAGDDNETANPEVHASDEEVAEVRSIMASVQSQTEGIGKSAVDDTELSILQDAQPREISPAPEDSLSSEASNKESSTEGPASKRAKTTHRPVASTADRGVRQRVLPWFRKAASNALYAGAWATVGAAAAIATLIATVPEETKEAAFADMQGR